MAKKRSADLLREAQQKAEDPQASATGAIKHSSESPEASGAASAEPNAEPTKSAKVPPVSQQPVSQQPTLEKSTAKAKSTDQATTVEPGSAIHLKGAKVQRTAHQPAVEKETAIKVTAEVLTAPADQMEPLKTLRNAEVIDVVANDQANDQRVGNPAAADEVTNGQTAKKQEAELATQAAEDEEVKQVEGVVESTVQSKAPRTAKKMDAKLVAEVVEAEVVSAQSVKPVEAEVVEVQVVEAAAKPVEEIKAREPVASVKLETEESGREKTTPPRHLPTQADMEAMIYRLKTDLEEVRRTTQDRESELQAQVERLRTEISTYQVTVRQLQNELKRSESLKTELDEAKQMILKLSQPPSAPSQSSAPPVVSQPPVSQPPVSQPRVSQPPSPPPTAPQISTSQPAPVPARSLPSSAPQKPAALSYLPSSRAAEPELESKPVTMTMPTMTTPAKPVSADRNKPYQVALHRVLDHPTLPGSLPPMSSEPKPADKEEVKLSEADVGWID